ncbi:hypothetical protein KSP39_PZI001529 [Platanthera zijinensis]|uniref:Uncharacterized protein n=1 Tax=Platanthera zijinensis TaxID=2320716 RepID=A0AAP0C565_9ASPA
MRSSSDTCKNPLDHSDSRMAEKRTDASGQFVWIPFVEAIVPEVDKERREMIITPPKGLLELNLRSDTRSKKERHQMEWKQRKKLHHRFNVAKKVLHEMGQSHLLDGFRIGEKDQKDKLAMKIVNANLRLFQHAVQSVGSSSTRLSLFDFVGANSNLLLKNALKIPHKYLLDCAYSEKNSELFKEGLKLLRNSKAAIILFVNDDRNFGEFAHHKLQKLLFDYRRFLKCEERNIEIPLIIMTSTDQIRSSEQLLLDNDYFGFNAEKVRFSEETQLPVAQKSAGSDKILLKSPWEILEAPTGSGGIFASLASHKGVEFLQEMGVEYVQVCALSEKSAFGSPLFFGQASSCKADISLKIIEDGKDEDGYDLIFSIGQMIKICKQMDALSFQAVLEQHEHVEMVDGEWTEIKPSSPNSYSLRCSIYSVLNSCSIDKISIMQVYA